MIAADLSEVRNPMRTLNNLMTKGQGSHYQVSDQVIAADTTRYRNPLDRINTKLTFSSLRRGSRLHSLLDVEEGEEIVLHSGSRDVATSGDVEITDSDGVDDIIGDNISVSSENERSDLNTKSELYQQGDVVNVTVLSVESDVEDVDEDRVFDGAEVVAENDGLSEDEDAAKMAAVDREDVGVVKKVVNKGEGAGVGCENKWVKLVKSLSADDDTTSEEYKKNVRKHKLVKVYTSTG